MFESSRLSNVATFQLQLKHTELSGNEEHTSRSSKRLRSGDVDFWVPQKAPLSGNDVGKCWGFSVFQHFSQVLRVLRIAAALSIGHE